MEPEPTLNTMASIPSPALVAWWWALFLLANVVSQVAWDIVIKDKTISDLLTSTYAYMILFGIDCIGYIITIILVRKISKSQEMRFYKLRQPTKQEAT